MYGGAEYKPLDLAAVPVDPTGVVTTYVCLAFLLPDAANSGVYTFGGYPVAVADVAAARARGVRFMASVGGDSVGGADLEWITPSNLASWEAKAVASLSSFITSYGLVGIDLDYEHPYGASWPSFSAAWCNVIATLRGTWPGLLFTLAPFESVDTPYQNLYQTCPSLVSWINRQTYAYTASQQQDALTTGASLYGGMAHLAVGFCTASGCSADLSSSAAATLLRNNPTVRGAFIWELEASATIAYAQSLIPVLQGLAGQKAQPQPQQSPQQSPPSSGGGGGGGTVLASGVASATYYYDQALSSCPGGASVAGVTNGYTTCSSYTPGPSQLTLGQMATNNIIAIGQLFGTETTPVSDAVRAQWCGKKVVLSINGQQVVPPSPGDFFVWDGCQACAQAGDGILDMSVSAIRLLNAQACTLGVVPGVSYQILDVQTHAFVE